MMHPEARQQLRRWREPTSIVEEREYCRTCGQVVSPNEPCLCTDRVETCRRQSLRVEACEHENE
jgi:hypothetical protein